MGYLNKFNLSSYGCNVYAETGTGLCVSLSKAARVFREVYSVDMDEDMVTNARLRFPDANIDKGLSADCLVKWLSSGQIKAEDKVLFFLDAHFPGADFKGRPYDVAAPNAVPLEEELRIIKKYRPNGQDYIICDDARIYLTGPFQGGNVPHLQVPGGLNFLNGMFPSANISVDFSEEGYILIDRRQS